MRTLWRNLGWALLVLASAAAITYVGDDLWARQRGRPLEQVKVDQVYGEMNRYNQLEYSAGKEVTESCLDALLPHFGLAPCWYLRRHTLQQIGDQ